MPYPAAAQPWYPVHRYVDDERLIRSLVVGKPVPDFETVDPDGNAFKLSDYRGKVTVIDFWGFW